MGLVFYHVCTGILSNRAARKKKGLVKKKKAEAILEQINELGPSSF
jgi:hypothetical protein